MFLHHPSRAPGAGLLPAESAAPWGGHGGVIVVMELVQPVLRDVSTVRISVRSFFARAMGNEGRLLVEELDSMEDSVPGVVHEIAACCSPCMNGLLCGPLSTAQRHPAVAMIRQIAQARRRPLYFDLKAGTLSVSEPFRFRIHLVPLCRRSHGGRGPAVGREGMGRVRK